MSGGGKAGSGLAPTVRRELLHTRGIEIRGYKREDGLYDVEGHLVDTKPYDFKLAAGVRPAGEPVHGMWLRITVDRTLVIVDAAAAMDAMPYVDYWARSCRHTASSWASRSGPGTTSV
jgi:hypothetical protein